MIKKIILAAFITVLSLSFISCSIPEKAKEDPVTFSVLYNNREDAPFKNDWRILEEYKNRKNVTLDVRLGDDKDFDKAIIQTLDSGNIPDIILKCYPETIESYAYDGILLAFSDYEDLMPNFMAYIKENNLQGELDKLRLSNGKYYILPGFQREIQVQQWAYRRDLFKKNNINIPKTYDELFDALEALKKIYPDSTPITGNWKGAHLLAMVGAGYGITGGWAGTRFYDFDTDRWLFSPATENWKSMISFLSRCYTAGILDPAIFTQEDQEVNTKIVDGRAMVIVTWITSGFKNWNDQLKENGFPEGDWAPFAVPESTIGIKALPSVNQFRKGLIVPSSVVNKPYFKALLTFLDWAVYSEEGMTLTTWGIDGLTYSATSGAKAYLPNIKTPKNKDGTLDVSKEYGLEQIFNLNENAEFEDYKKPEEIVKFLEASQKAKDTEKISPTLKLDDNSNKTIDSINANILSFAEESRNKFITGELSMDKDWQKYLSELDKMGYKTLEATWNDAWKKQNEKE